MKFLIVDDHALIREAMRSVLLSLRSDASVLEAVDAQTALHTLQRQPDKAIPTPDIKRTPGSSSLSMGVGNGCNTACV